MRYEGRKAIKKAKALGLTLSKYTDPTERAREGLSVSQAEDIAAEDPSLIYLDTENGEIIRQGLVLLDGQWVTPAQRKAILDSRR